jgi:predicted HicB family RNase H-like nuclease
MTYRGFTAAIEYDEESGHLVGRVIDSDSAITFGVDPKTQEPREVFETLIDEHLAYCRKRGIEPSKSYSGRFQVRLGPDLHREIDTTARARGMSINDFMREAASRALQMS